MITFESFSNIQNPIYSDETGKRISFIADIEGIGSGVPFTASDTDPEQYGRELYSAALNGNYGTISAYIPPAPDPTQVTAANTAKFNRLLVAAGAAAFPLQSAVNLGVATQEDRDALAALQQYAIDLADTDLTQNPVQFPVVPAGIKLPL